MKAILTDMSGTTTPIAIADELMQDFREYGTSYIQLHDDPQTADLVERIRKEAGLNTREEVVSFIDQQFAQGIEPSEYVDLLFRVNLEGYEKGRLQGKVFPDVPEAFARWKQNGKSLYVYSNGSVPVQNAIFRTTSYGDLTTYIDRFFDPANVGDKAKPESYKRIGELIEAAPSDVLFLSDSLRELDAANGAGCNVRAVIRPGNKPLKAHSYKSVESFAGIELQEQY